MLALFSDFNGQCFCGIYFQPDHQGVGAIRVNNNALPQVANGNVMWSLKHIIRLMLEHGLLGLDAFDGGELGFEFVGLVQVAE